MTMEACFPSIAKRSAWTEPDSTHFDLPAERNLGQRYAQVMLTALDL